MIPSANAGQEPALLFSDLYTRVIVCLFCGSTGESRYMCSKCRPIPLQTFWVRLAKMRAKG